MALIRINPHEQAIQAAQQEIQQRLAERQWIDQRIAKLQEDIRVLSQSPQEPEDSATLPVLCLRVLSFTPGHGVSVPRVRDGLASIGVRLEYKNPLAVLHTTLGRLEQAGYVRTVPMVDGQRSHFQITPAGILYLQGTFKGPAPGGF